MYPRMQDSEKEPMLNNAERQQVNAALEAILATDKFEAAPQMSAFLRYVVEQAANGRQNRIKAFTVAVDALGKPDNFDPQNDPVVRVLAGRLRASLSAYNDENPDAALMITMKPGSYVPAFLAPQSIRDNAFGNGSTLAANGNSSDALDIDLSKADDTTDQNSQTDESAAQISNTESKHEKDVFATGSNFGLKEKTPVGSGDSQPTGLFGNLVTMISGAPKRAFALALIVAVAFAYIQKRENFNAEPDIQAATGAATASGSARCRPYAPSVLISAVDQGIALENNLNALVSGVISESEEVDVYRILDEERDTIFWPEDYILTLKTLDLPDETRVNMQLMEATTGRIVHSEAVALNELATEQITQQELGKLINAARLIVSESGPLLKDYAAKEVTR